MTELKQLSDKEQEEKNNNKNDDAEEGDNDDGNTKCSVLQDLEGDKMHVVVLFFLYILQGIPLGLINAVPLVLTKKNVPYADQAIFSFSGYPFSMKLLWAPLVDSVYYAKFGRRKSWLVPVQYLIGFLMLIGSQVVGDLLGDSDDPDKKGEIDITSLTVLFFFMNFLAATQDVAVDGWALTMLQPKNVGYASTCNSVGQTTGWCLGYIVYTTLDGYGLVTLDQFLLFWGIAFLITTTGILFFKKEKNAVSPLKWFSKESSVSPETQTSKEEESGEPELGLIDTYKVLWKMLRHHLVPVMIVLLLTAGFAFSTAEELTNRKMLDKGVPKEKIAMLAIPMIPVKIILTIFLTRFTVGPRPMNVWMIGYPFRLVFCLGLVLIVYITPMFAVPEEDGKSSFSVGYYTIVIGILALHRCALYAMFVAIMAFFARVSDPAVGGTYMTFLNTLSNLGNMWPSSFVLWFVDVITVKECSNHDTDLPSPFGSISNATLSASNETVSSLREAGNVCYGTDQIDACKEVGGDCATLRDGYFGLSIVGILIGFIWFIWAFRTLRKLQEIDVKEWRVVSKPDEKIEKKKYTDTKFKFFYCF